MRSILSTRRGAWPFAAALFLSALALLGVARVPAASPAHASTRAATRPHIAYGGTVVIDNESGGLWTNSFTPFSTNTNYTVDGVIYEPLMFFNSLNGNNQPWLATSYQWSNGNKTLTFTLRHGVRWSDGVPFSAADVVFTFNMMKKNPGLDLNGVWGVLSSVQSPGGDRVVMTFKAPSVPYLYYIGVDPIVSQHEWAAVKNPVTFADSKPIGTGPFMVGQSSTQSITYVRNPHYWQAGLPYVDKVVYPAFLSNPPANLYLAEGQADWGGQYIPNVQAYYVARDPAHNHYWYAPQTNDVGLFPNLTEYPLSLTAVRQAISYGIDRSKISNLGVFGYLPPANQSGVIVPNFQGWLDTGLAQKYNYGYNPQKAMALLKGAGFKQNAAGVFQTAAGKPLSFSVITVGGNTDWVAEVKILSDELHQIGINVQPQNLSGNDFNARLFAGHYDLAYDNLSGGPSPFYPYHGLLSSGASAPIGQDATSNYERYHSAEADALLAQFAVTTDSAQQHAIINKLQNIMLRDVPVVPVLEGVNWFQWSSAKFTGWPSQANPYADPAPYAYPDWEVVLLHLHKI